MSDNRKSAITARDAAFAALKKVSGGAYSSIALDEVLEKSELQKNDAALASAIFYGVLENEKCLDAAVEKCLTKPGQKIKKDARIILHMGLYQIAFMDRIPDRAAVDQSVALARKNGLAGLAGFINAVLRAYIRQNGKEKSADIPGAECPAWITGLWAKAYGEEIKDKLISCISGRPPIYARVNTTRCTAEKLIERLNECGVEAEYLSWIPGAIELKSTGSISRLAPYSEGLLHIQDISSQLCCAALDAKPGDTVLDVCSAPGGKTFTTAEMMGDNGRVIACDLHPHRVELIASGARRLGLTCVEAVVRDALTANDGIEADRILCDVPCSGLGVLRRKPDVMKKTPQEIAELPDLQYNILSSSARFLKSGGVLVYSTCTLNPEENVDVIRRFMDSHDDFEPYPLDFPKQAASVIGEPSYCRTMFPHTTGGDGFFIARVRRK